MASQEGEEQSCRCPEAALTQPDGEGPVLRLALAAVGESCVLPALGEEERHIEEGAVEETPLELEAVEVMVVEGS